MNKENIRYAPKMNAVGDMYAKITGSRLIGQMMNAAGEKKVDYDFTVVSPVFFCATSTIYLYIIVENPVTEEDIPTADYTNNSGVYDMRLNEGSEITEERIPQLLLTFPDFDFTPYIGKYLIGFANQNEINIGDTYKFRVNGIKAITTTAVCNE